MNFRQFVRNINNKYGPTLCRARCRDGHLCKRTVALGRIRCPNHGGLSTGPNTYEGIQRIKAANRKRWKDYREAKASVSVSSDTVTF